MSEPKPDPEFYEGPIGRYELCAFGGCGNRATREVIVEGPFAAFPDERYAQLETPICDDHRFVNPALAGVDRPEVPASNSGRSSPPFASRPSTAGPATSQAASVEYRRRP